MSHCKVHLAGSQLHSDTRLQTFSCNLYFFLQPLLVASTGQMMKHFFFLQLKPEALSIFMRVQLKQQENNIFFLSQFLPNSADDNLLVLSNTFYHVCFESHSASGVSSLPSGHAATSEAAAATFRFAAVVVVVIAAHKIQYQQLHAPLAFTELSGLRFLMQL